MIGNQIIHLDRVDSTSNYVATLVSEQKARHGMVILAETQTNGRGQRGAVWQSESFKNLLFSIYLEHKQLPIQQQSSLTHLVSLAILEGLAKIGLTTQIKWPNDILVGTKKIAGILIENQLRGTNIHSSIIGIGINVLQTTFDFSGSTSVCLALKKTITKEEVLNHVLDTMNRLYENIVHKQYHLLKASYLEKLWLLNTESSFEQENETFRGIIRGTDEYGRLVIEREQKLVAYDLKEIKFTLRNEP